jgi:hypothetical protein
MGNLVGFSVQCFLLFLSFYSREGLDTVQLLKECGHTHMTVVMWEHASHPFPCCSINTHCMTSPESD